MTVLLLNDTTTGNTTLLANGDIVFKDIGGDANYTDNNHYSHTFDAGVGYKVKMEIRNNWEFEPTHDRLGFRTKETATNDWVNGNVPWFRKMDQTDLGPNVWGLAYGADSLLDGWVIPYIISVLNGTIHSAVSDTAVDGFIPINFVGDAQIVSWHFMSDGSQTRPGWEIKISRVPAAGMTELLLNPATSGNTTYLADGDIIFKDIGGDANYTPNNNYFHMFDAGVGYKVTMKIRDNWRFEDYFDRLGFRTKETAANDWFNGNVPWFYKTEQTDLGANGWDGNGTLGDGWVVPYMKSVLDDSATYNYVSGTAVDGFIPINFVGDAQIVSWHFRSDNSAEYVGWEIIISRVPTAAAAAAAAAANDSAVTCMGTGTYNVTGTGSITCS